MGLTQVSSLVERRLLVNYRVDPDVAARLLPAPLRPQLMAGWAVAGICLIRLARVRPAWVPAGFGLRSENAAHRIAVEWDQAGCRRAGVYIPRRDSDSAVSVIVGGRLFPGEHHRASFDVRESGRELHVAFASADGTARASVDVRVADQFGGSTLFAGVRQASDFFRCGSTGFSATRGRQRLEGVELNAARWAVEPVEARAVSSSFFDDPGQFPPGSAVFDCALLMRDIPATWNALQPIRGHGGVTGRAKSARAPNAPRAADEPGPTPR